MATALEKADRSPILITNQPPQVGIVEDEGGVLMPFSGQDELFDSSHGLDLGENV